MVDAVHPQLTEAGNGYSASIQNLGKPSNDRDAVHFRLEFQCADLDANLLTVNDRMSNYCLIRYLPTKNADDLKKTLVRALRDYRKTFPLYTITSDNGKEFACHLDIAKALGVEYYFAHPYHSWERGANENMNGLIRQYLPKKESFKGISPQKVRWIQDKLNNRPRKRLAFMTPLEYICMQVKQADRLR